MHEFSFRHGARQSMRVKKEQSFHRKKKHAAIKEFESHNLEFICSHKLSTRFFTFRLCWSSSWMINKNSKTRNFRQLNLTHVIAPFVNVFWDWIINELIFARWMEARKWLFNVFTCAFLGENWTIEESENTGKIIVVDMWIHRYIFSFKLFYFGFIMLSWIYIYKNILIYLLT